MTPGIRRAGTHKIMDKDHSEWTMVVTNRTRARSLLDLFREVRKTQGLNRRRTIPCNVQ